METLRIFSSRSDAWLAPHLDVEPSAFTRHTLRWRTRQKWYQNSYAVETSNPCLLCVASYSSEFRIRAFSSCSYIHTGCSCYSKRLSFELFVFQEANGVSRAWDLEEQRIGNLILKNVDDEAVDSIKLNGEEFSSLSQITDGDGINYEGTGKGTNDQAELGKKNTKVDVRELAWKLREAKTAEDIEAILSDKGDLPYQVFSSMIRGFGKDKLIQSAISLVEWLKRKKRDTDGCAGLNLFIYNSLLGAMKQAKQHKGVEKVINDMAMEGIQPNVVTYNTLMGIYLEQGLVSDALNIFDDIQKKNLSPSPATYSTVLLAYRKLEDGFGALNFFVDVREKYYNGEIGENMEEEWKIEFAKLEDFTVRVCNQVMRRWLVNTENLSTKVLKLLIEMDKAGLQIGRAEHERLVWACTRVEHYVVVKELYYRIRERSGEISLSVCNHVIWLMGKAKKWWEALEIYEELLDEGPEPNNMTYELIVSHFNILLTAARKRGIWKWGVNLLNKMEEKGLKPGSKEWNAVLIACSKASETSTAVEIFRRMVERGEKPTIVSYGALLSALEKGKLYDQALQVWKHMIKVGVEPNLYAYTIMASMNATQGKLNIVESIIREMSTSGIAPTVVTFNAIISGFARTNMGSAAYEWFQRMKAENVAPNEVTYEILIEVLANDGKPRLAYELYTRAHIEGLDLSSKAYDAVIGSSQAYGATIDASGLGPRPREKQRKGTNQKTI